MSFLENADNLRIAAQPQRFARPTASFVAPTPVFVDIGSSAVEANITRGGSKLPSVALDIGVIGDIIGTIQPRTKLKVLRQSVEAGRAVERGSAVDLVLSDPGGLPLRIVDGVHVDLVERTVSEVFTDLIQPNPALSKLLADKTDYVSLTSADKTLIAGALSGSNIDPADDDAVSSVFAGFQAAKVFGG